MLLSVSQDEGGGGIPDKVFCCRCFVAATVAVAVVGVKNPLVGSKG
jgi:hypothetical protein